MIQDFICLNCRNKFRADDIAETSCPYCKSDNISISSGSSVKYIIAILCFVLFAAVGYLLPLNESSNSESIELDILPPSDMSDDHPIVINDIEEEDANMASVPKILNITTPALKNGKYVVEIAAEVKRGRLSYEIRKEPGYELVNSNNSGKFEDVPYSESGMYRIEVINLDDPQYKDYTIINGFDKPANELPKITKISSDDIERYLNNKDIATLNKSCRNARITIVNPEDAGQTPADCNGVVLNLRMEVWSRVEVEQVNYNSQNYVTSIKLRVIPN